MRLASERSIGDAFGSDPDYDLPTLVVAEERPLREDGCVERETLTPEEHGDVTVRALNRPVDEIHGRRSDEAADEDVDGPVVELLRCCELLQPAVAHHRDAVAHRHRLDLVVCDVDRRCAELPLKPADLGARVNAKLRIEIRERLVHQKHRRLAHDRATHRDALSLTSG